MRGKGVKMLKTEKGWHESKKNLTEYLNVGDKVDEDMFDYFLGVLPPIQKPGVLQINEPYDTNRKGAFTYMTLKKNNDNWHYIGTLSTKDAVEYKFN